VASGVGATRDQPENGREIDQGWEMQKAQGCPIRSTRSADRHPEAHRSESEQREGCAPVRQRKLGKPGHGTARQAASSRGRGDLERAAGD